MTDDVHAFISDILHRRGVVDQDGYALRAAKAVLRVQNWNLVAITSALSRVQTDLFRRHRSWPRVQVSELIATRLLQRWKTHPSAEDNARLPEVIKILFLAANPVTEIIPGVSKTPLALDEEIREIRQKIRASRHRQALELLTRVAARPDDLIQELNEVQPQIVHFSGHGTNRDEIILLNAQRHAQPVSKTAIESLFKTLRDRIRVVVLNACFSAAQAAAITKHIDCAIGMKRAIGDEAAITFAASFYRAIGFGHSVARAFEEGITALKLAGIKEDSTPQLLLRNRVDPTRLTLIPK